VENENGGLFSSDDAGATWKLVNEGRNIRQRAFYYTHVTADPKEKDTVYVLNVGAFKSTDGGKTMVSFAGGDSHDLWIDPDDTQHIMHASDGGGAVTYNAASPQRTWTERDYATGQFYHAITTVNVPYHVCGAQQDSSTICVPSEMTVPIPAAPGQTTGRAGGRATRREAPSRVTSRRIRKIRMSSLPVGTMDRFSRGSTGRRMSCARSDPTRACSPANRPAR
jgi:hypothetical protein